MAKPRRVHLVGSVPFNSAEEVFLKSLQALPGRLSRVPDGETGSRHYFAMWQSFVFPPQVLGPIHRKGQPLASTDFECSLEDINPTKYDEMGIKSYKVFRKLRNDGFIPQGIRLQVSIPTPINTIWTHVDCAYREQVEPLYTKRLSQDLRRLQDAIPACDLAIQIDTAMEFAYIEYARGRIQDDFFRPYSSPVKEGILERISHLPSTTDQDVHLGFHLCYGDRQHEHFIQPEDAGNLVDIATAISKRVGPQHPIQWIHMPVPKDRLDAAYYEPVKRLDIGDTELFLGVVHAHDERRTRERLEMAQSVYPHSFGVATECEWGGQS